MNSAGIFYIGEKCLYEKEVVEILNFYRNELTFGINYIVKFLDSSDNFHITEHELEKCEKIEKHEEDSK